MNKTEKAPMDALGQGDIYCAACGEYGDGCECEQPDQELWYGGRWHIQNVPLRTRRLLDIGAAFDSCKVAGWEHWQRQVRDLLAATDDTPRDT